jgi:DNA phosphorothioation-dependent restriction protein DptH
MPNLVKALVKLIQEKVLDESQSSIGSVRESRYIFHGPPLSIMEDVFNEFMLNGGISLSKFEDNTENKIAVLLQLPTDQITIGNPAIGSSGKCSHDHLLNVRNDPNKKSSFLALIPPGQHSNMSVASTTEEFGVSSSANTLHSTIDDWWSDGFIQNLFLQSLINASFEEDELDDAIAIVKSSIYAIDDMDKSTGDRTAAWNLLSRIFSISEVKDQISKANALSLACGVPSLNDKKNSSKSQLGVLTLLASELNEGFRTGIERLQLSGSAEADPAIKLALGEFLEHIQNVCEVSTAFERSTEAFYIPHSDSKLHLQPPKWWSILTTEVWMDIFGGEGAGTGQSSQLNIECINSLVSFPKGLPSVVEETVDLSIGSPDFEKKNQGGIVTIAGGGIKIPLVIPREKLILLSDCPVLHKSPLIYKCFATDSKSVTCRVISLKNWAPGIYVACRLASKISSPKKAPKSKVSSPWEQNISLPGSGRYELLIFTSPDITLIKVTGLTDDSIEFDDSVSDELHLQQIKTNLSQVEVEADSKYQVEIKFQRGNDAIESCVIFITCDETKEEGCRSEFERLIKLNRKILEKFDVKTVVQIDRHARISSLQAWLLDEQNAGYSYRPIVLADDYFSKWSQPNWNMQNGPIISNAKFLHDPRPDFFEFIPPEGFIEARLKIAEYIRSTGDNTGLIESAPLGKWFLNDKNFSAIVEQYLSLYLSWLANDRETACWVDVIAVCSRSSDGRTLERIPDAILLSPLHPLKLAWHCLAQKVLINETEGSNAIPCPASSILDPDCVPDCLELFLQSPNGSQGIENHTFLSIECNSDYWSVLWNGSRLKNLSEKSDVSPFDKAMGLSLGGISSGFSPAQVARALEDVSDILSAKSVISLTVSSAGGATDACNEGLATWCTKRFGTANGRSGQSFTGSRTLEIYDIRPSNSRPDQATIANLSEDTSNRVRWFLKQPENAKPDIGIVAQLDSAEADVAVVGMKSPIGFGGLLRHRVRKQLNGTFLCESRQSLTPDQSGDFFADKVTKCIVALESGTTEKIGLQFSPNVPSITAMLQERNASFVAVSSSAIDPACFLGGWIPGTYLWDYDLPSYSHRAGDSSGYYLLSQVRESDKDALKRVLDLLDHDGLELTDEFVQDVLIEIARRGIPTVRGMSSDDTGATGDLGLFIASRLLQDQFRLTGNVNSLFPVISGTEEDLTISIIIPVDPFRGYLADLSKSLAKDKKDLNLSRPDLLVIGIRIVDSSVSIKLTPLEVKCRLSNTLSINESKEALLQAKALSSLFNDLQEISQNSEMWKLAYQHLLLSMVGFGLRVYSQHSLASQNSTRWAKFHEQIAHEILRPLANIYVDVCGRLIVIDTSAASDAKDNDGDGFTESIVITMRDAGRIVSGDASVFYDSVIKKVDKWDLLPSKASIPIAKPLSLQVKENEPNTFDIYRETTPSNIEQVIQAPMTEPVIVSHSSTGIELALGETKDGFEPRKLSLNISDTRLNNLNIGVVGDLGTGKTQLLKSLIYQIVEDTQRNRGVKPRLLIFDYKRDYSSPEFVNATGAKVVRPSHLPLNLFDTSSIGDSLNPWLDRFRFFCDILDKVYSGIGGVQRSKLKSAVKNAYANVASGGPPTIYDVHREYGEIVGDRPDTPMSIIDDLVDMAIFEQDVTKTINFDDFLDGVVVISLDALGPDDRSKNLLVAIMLNMFYENMLKTEKRPFVGTDPQLRVVDSYLLVDEADNIMRYDFDVLRNLLLQGREFGTGVILASQYLRHFKTSAMDYKDPLLTWFIHKVPNVTANELSTLGCTSDLIQLSEQVKTLPNHHCLYKSFGVSGEVIHGLPFYQLMKDRDLSS